MSDEIKNPNNQVDRSANGKFHVLWHGVLVNTSAGTVREFDTEHEARTYLARCDAARRLVD